MVGGQAACWPGSRAHRPLLWPGRHFLQASEQPLRRRTRQTAGLVVGTAGVGGRVDQMAPQGSFLLRCLGSLCSLFPHPKMGGAPGHRPRNPMREERGQQRPT